MASKTEQLRRAKWVTLYGRTQAQRDAAWLRVFRLERALGVAPRVGRPTPKAVA